MSEKQQRIIIPGGSGFLGRTLTEWYASRGCQVTILSRDPAPVSTLANANANANVIAWDGKNMGAWADHLDGADAVINLAGRSVNCRYHAANRRLMMDSRIDSTLVLGKAIAACSNPPEVWLNSSTATMSGVGSKCTTRGHFKVYHPRRSGVKGEVGWSSSLDLSDLLDGGLI